MKLSVVIAAYDEAECIETLLTRLEKVLTAMPGVTPEAIFVVEGSDGTDQILARSSAHLPWVRVLYSAAPSGLGAAFRRGFAAVSDDADYVITLDADLNHQPEEIPRLLEAAKSRDLDILVGSRFVAGSEIVGTPIWKRALSGSVNRLMRCLYGPLVRDKTSGFRVYRASTLRQLSFRNNAFAFLPELLIEASRAGHRIGEEPIHFTYRREGRSKMAFWPTSWSYLTMLARRFDRVSWAVLALLIVGLALRVGLTFPIGKLQSEADSSLNGLCALKVLRGETPVFASYTRLGSVGAHLTALLIYLGAELRTALAIGPLFESVALMGFWFLFMVEVIGRRAAAVALLFIAVPSPSYNFWTTMPNGYPEVVLFCGMVLWAAARALRSRGELWPFFALGLAAGLGLWSSLQTLGCTAPAVAWLIWKRPRVLASWAPVLMLAGFLCGAFPWLAYNLRYDFASLNSGYATSVTPGLRAMFDNVLDLTTYKLPELVGSHDERFWPHQTRSFRGLHLPVLAVHLAAAMLCLYRVRRDWRPGSFFSSAASSPKAPQLLFVLVLVTMATLNVISVAGMGRGVTVRYILPVYLVVPGMLAILILWIGARFRAVAWVIVALLLTFNVTGTYLPWTYERSRHVRSAVKEEQLIEFLNKKGVDAILGGYWLVYPITYQSNERLHAIPIRARVDHYDLERRLGEKPLRWAVVTQRGQPELLEQWVERSGLRGRIRNRPGYRVFLTKDRLPAPEFLSNMREVWFTMEREKRLAARRGAS